MQDGKSIYFDPIGVVENKEDFTRELLIYRERENIDIYITRDGIEPEIKINGKKYVGILEYLTLVRTDNKILKAMTFVGNTYGYKIIALYPTE